MTGCGEVAVEVDSIILTTWNSIYEFEILEVKEMQRKLLANGNAFKRTDNQ